MTSTTFPSPSNQQTCRLLILPAELRLQIYEHILTTSIYVLDAMNDMESRSPHNGPLASTPFLLTCKAFYQEALPLVCRNTFFVVDMSPTWTSMRSGQVATDHLPEYGCLALQLIHNAGGDPVASTKATARLLHSMYQIRGITLARKNFSIFDKDFYGADKFVDRQTLNNDLQKDLAEAGCTDAGLRWRCYWGEKALMYDGLRRLLLVDWVY